MKIVSAVNQSLRISLLGPPYIHYQDDMLSIPRRIVRALLFYLAVHTAPVSRAKLCLLLWPDASELDARRNFTRTLTHLRRALPFPQSIVTDADLVFLDKNYFTCDVNEFHELIHDRTRPDLMERGLGLYRESFLSGFYLPESFEFEEWITQQKTALENQLLRILSWLVDQKTTIHDYGGAILLAQRYLEVDKLSEDMHRRLIELYSLTGDRTRALQQYETCITILESELGAKPLPETQAAYQAAIGGKPTDLQPVPVDVVFPSSIRRLSDIPLVGRNSALKQLEEVQKLVDSGKSKFVLISGEAGIGKSRILYDFAVRSKIKGQVLYGSGQPGEYTVPYHPIVDAFRSVPVSTQLSLPPYWMAEVIRLLPELKDIFPDVPAPVKLKGDEARIRLFDALCQYLFTLQQGFGFVLLCFDDLHWFDRTSLSWLIHLCRKLSANSHHVMIVGTYRGEDETQILELRNNLSRLDLLTELSLEGLDLASIQQLFDYIFIHSSCNEALASRIKSVTGGNPFFIIEILKALDEERRLPENLEQMEDFPLPASVRETIERRFSRLNPRSKQVLEAGAVLGASFSFKALQMTAGRSELETSQSLENLETRKLVMREAGKYHFCHDLIRRLAIQTLNPLRFQILHARAGKALEKLEPTEVTILAQHFDAGGDWKKALQYYERAISKSEAIFAWQEVEASLKRILVLIDESDLKEQISTYAAHKYKFLSRLINIHYVMGRYLERDEDLRQLQDLYDTFEDPVHRLGAILLRVQHLNNDARYHEAIIAAKPGLSIHPPGSENLQGRLMAQLGMAYLFSGQPVFALEAVQTAQSHLEGTEDLELKSAVFSQLGTLNRINGDHRKALEYFQVAYDCYRKLGDPYGMIRFIEIGNILTNLCRFDEAKPFLDECLELTRKVGLPVYEGHTLLALGGWHLYRGNPVEAIEILMKATQILSPLRSQHLTASAWGSIGFAYYHLVDIENSRKWLLECLALSESIGNMVRIATALIQLGMLEIRGGRLIDAQVYLEKGIKIAWEVQSKELISICLIAIARLMRFTKSFPETLDYTDKALRNMEGLPLSSLEMWAHMEAGLASADLGDYPTALDHTNQALGLIPTSHQLWIAHEHVFLAYARVLGQLGDHAASREHFHRAKNAMIGKSTLIQDPIQQQNFLSACEENSFFL